MEQTAHRYNRNYTTNSRMRYYNYNGNAALKHEPQRKARPDVVVLPGDAKNNPRAQTLSARSVFVFKVLLVAALVFAAVCGIRIWLSTSTVQTLESIETLQTSVSEARSAGNELEIEHSTLANPTRIQQKAKGIGMSYADKTERIEVVLPAAIATYQNGSISVANTIASIESNLSAS